MVKILNGISLGCQSWCYRNFHSAEKLASLLQESDLDSLELCSAHCDFSSKDDWKKAADEYKALGITLNSCGINWMPKDEASVRSIFEFAAYAGVKTVGADPDPDALELIERLCDEYGCKIAIHNHGKRHRYGFEHQLDEIFAKTSANVGLCLDTGWALDASLDPVKCIEKYADRLYGIHLKDFTFDATGAPEETVLGTGILDLPGVIEALRKIGFAGYASLEYEGDASDPAPKITACVENLKKAGA